jgi:hypothetical protein
MATGTITDANGKVLGRKLHGNSICAFSGLNIPSEDGDPSRVQSYGQVVKSVLDSGGKRKPDMDNARSLGMTRFRFPLLVVVLVSLALVLVACGGKGGGY